MGERVGARAAIGIPGRRYAFAILCLGYFMNVLDGTIVNVALPSISADLGFSPSSLVWVVDGYLITYACFLILGGRLADLFGPGHLFLLGIALFTFASLLCGLAFSPDLLICARAIQGLGSAVTSAVTLSLTMTLFPQDVDRARAMAIYSFITVGGDGLGFLLGGTLTSALNWRWIFLINVPLGATTYALGRVWLPDDRRNAVVTCLDIAGSLIGTSSLILVVHAIVNGNETNWTSLQTLGEFVGAITLMILFVNVESRATNPIVPLTLLRNRALLFNNIGVAFWSAAIFVWYYVSALYLQVVLHYSPLQTGLAFLPANLANAAFCLGVSAKVIRRFGIRRPLAIGSLVTAAGLILLALAPLDGTLAIDVLPGMLLVGLGSGLASAPLLIATMGDADSSATGLFAGIINTSSVLGATLGLAVATSAAAVFTRELFASGAGAPVALTGGYHFAFIIGAVFAASGYASIALALPRVFASK